MSPITEELIHQSFDCFDRTQIEKTEDGWLLTTPTGRTVKIHDYHIDFRGITTIMPGEMEKEKELGKYDLNREQLQFELMSLAMEAWGVVSLISCRSEEVKGEGGNLWIYGKCYKLKMEGPWWRFSSTQVKRHFGDEATMKLRFGGYRIDAGKGMSATISFNAENELMVTKSVGESGVLEAAILLVHEVQGHVIASGSKDNILSSLAHGETLGVEVIPELYITQKRSMAVGMAVGAICWPVGMIIGLAIDENISTGLLVGVGLGIVVLTSYRLLFQRNTRAKARERGQALKSPYPSMGKRQSNIDDARARGML